MSSVSSSDYYGGNSVVMNTGKMIIPSFNFMLRVEGVFDIPCKSVRAFTKENEFEYIREGGLNDYVHLKRKPISKPFTFVVERYAGVDYIDYLPLGAELTLPVILMVSLYQDNWFPARRTYTFTGCTVMSKEYGELNAERAGLLTESVTISYRSLLKVDLPIYEDAEEDFYMGKDGPTQYEFRRKSGEAIYEVDYKDGEQIFKEKGYGFQSSGDEGDAYSFRKTIEYFDQVAENPSKYDFTHKSGDKLLDDNGKTALDEEGKIQYSGSFGIPTPTAKSNPRQTFSNVEPTPSDYKFTREYKPFTKVEKPTPSAYTFTREPAAKYSSSNKETTSNPVTKFTQPEASPSSYSFTRKPEEMYSAPVSNKGSSSGARWQPV